MEPSREAFLSVSDAPGDTFRLLIDLRNSTDGAADQDEQLVEEALILDLMVDYVSSHDAKNLDWTLSTFTSEDDLDTQGRRRREILAEQYSTYNYVAHDFSRHRICNIVVHIWPGCDEAWLSGYWHVSRTGYPGEVTSRYGHYFWRLVKEDGRWLIADRRGSGIPVFESEYLDLLEEAQRTAAQAGIAQIEAQRSSIATASTRDAEMSQHATAPLLAGHNWFNQFVLAHPSHPNERLEPIARLQNERDLRDLASSFSYAIDLQDEELLQSFLADGIVLFEREQWSAGRSHVAAQFLNATRDIVRSQHRISNIVSRVIDDGRRAWVSLQYHFAAEDKTGTRWSEFGRWLCRAERTGRSWQILQLVVWPFAVLPLRPASNRSRSLSMPEIPSPRIEFDHHLNMGTWAAQEWILRMQKLDCPRDARSSQLLSELDAREVVYSFLALLDNREAGAASELFSESGVLSTRSGHARGRHAIAERLRHELENESPTLRRAMNTATRMTRDGELLISSYIYSIVPMLRLAYDARLTARLVQSTNGPLFEDLNYVIDRRRHYPTN